MKFDFSKYHPLDHRPGTARCRAHYGSWRYHLRLAWVMGRRDQVLRPFRRVLFCPWGRHRWRVWYGYFGDRPVQVDPVCADCPATRLPSEQEIDGARDLPDFGA